MGSVADIEVVSETWSGVRKSAVEMEVSKGRACPCFIGYHMIEQMRHMECLICVIARIDIVSR